MNTTSNSNGFIIAIGLCIYLFIIIVILYKILINQPYNETNEDFINDSINKNNIELINEINYLDSIKNAKIIEVQNIDNDSTLKLFYQLIGD